jgi:hypothetical protein
MANLITPEVQAQLKAKMAELAAAYAPTLAAMTADDFKKWLDYALVGQHDQAYAMLIKATATPDLLASWDKLHADWATANAANADKIALQGRIAEAVVMGLVGILATGVGL